MKLVPEQTVLGSGDHEETVQQTFVPVTVLVVPQLLVWVKLVPEQTVLGSGDHDVTLQHEIPVQIKPALQAYSHFLVVPVA